MLGLGLHGCRDEWAGYLLVSIAVIKRHDQKQLRDERVYFAYTPKSQLIAEGGQDGNMAAMEERYLLLSYTTQDHPPRDGTLHSG